MDWVTEKAKVKALGNCKAFSKELWTSGADSMVEL